MNCEKFEAKISDYVESELSASEYIEFSQHLKECRKCSDMLEKFRKQERLLERYYESLNKSALGIERPELEEKKVPSRFSRLTAYSYSVAAVFILLFLSGIVMLITHQIIKSRTDGVIGVASQVMGKVQYIKDNKLVNLAEGTRITPNMRLKTTRNSYLCVKLLKEKNAKKDNFVEFKDNSYATFLAYNNRTVLNLDRGEAWIHLNDKEHVPFAVKTRQFIIKDIGTTFNVAQGMTGTYVGVLEGSVEFEYNGEKKTLAEGENFATFGGNNIPKLSEQISWSHYRENLLAMIPSTATSSPAAQTSSGLLQVKEYLPEETEKSITPVSSKKALVSTTNLMPSDTRFFFEIANLPQVLNEFQKSAYSNLFKDKALFDWWNSPQMEDARNFVNDKLRLPAWLKLSKTINGAMSISVNSEAKFLLVADCRNSAQEAESVIKSEILPYLPEETLKKFSPNSAHKPLAVKNGYFIASTDERLLVKTLELIDNESGSGFTETQFYQNLRANVPQSRLTIAYDFKSTMDAIIAKGDERQLKILKRTGFDGLDYVLGSPDFSGMGLNQAFRLAFTGERHGMAAWLDNPAPMSSLRYFAPDVHLFVAAKIKNPLNMLSDVVDWEMEDTKGEWTGWNTEEFKMIQDFASCLGNEVAIGIENPVLPIPNVQAAVELVDPLKFHDMMIKLIDTINEANPNNPITIEDKDYREHLIITLSNPRWHIKISYVILEDFVVFGIGEPFVRHTVDVFMENHSIMDEGSFQRMLPEAGQLNFSILLYQDLTRSVPQLFNETLKKNLVREKDLLPDFNMVKEYGGSGISYAFSNDKYIDFYINGSSGVDFNMGGLLPFVANLLVSKAPIKESADIYEETKKSLRTVATALEAYYVDFDKYPDNINDLISPVHYLTEIPLDLYSKDASEPINYYLNTGGKTYTIYSVGPDGIDNLGKTIYDPNSGTDSEGDIVRVGGQE